MKYRLSKEVMGNDSLRTAFNALTIQTFGFSFEEWYQRGYWSDFVMKNDKKAIWEIEPFLFPVISHT